MKALELTVYPKLERPTRGDEIMAYRSQFIDEQLIIQQKRLTDAELAAEYWAEYSVYVREASNFLHCQERYMAAAGKSFQEEQRKCAVLYRFTTLPHYDEAAA